MVAPTSFSIPDGAMPRTGTADTVGAASSSTVWSIARWALPCGVREALAGHLSRRRAAREWSVVPGWDDQLARGWDVPAVSQAQARRVRIVTDATSTTAPLALDLEGDAGNPDDIGWHNTIVTFAYVAALARRDGRLSVLDWGGGLGQYSEVARAALPGVAIDYHVVEVPATCEAGRRVGMPATFHRTDEAPLDRRYDLVVCSSALQYEHDWPATLATLARVTDGYLYLTRLPIVTDAASFVVLQRATSYGYDTEYLGWFLNVDELREVASAQGLRLLREFPLHERPLVPGAPEQAVYRGFLFAPESTG